MMIIMTLLLLLLLSLLLLIVVVLVYRKSFGCHHADVTRRWKSGATTRLRWRRARATGTASASGPIDSATRRSGRPMCSASTMCTYGSEGRIGGADIYRDVTDS